MTAEETINLVYDAMDTWNGGEKTAADALVEIQALLDKWEAE